MTTRIHYINTLPGVGKTHWIMDQIERFIHTHLTGDQQARQRLPRAVLYVAPTHQLLDQQATVLLRRLDASLPPAVLKRFDATAQDWLIHWNASLLGKTTAQRQADIDLPVRDGVLRCRPGTVIFMTHEAFLRLPYSDNEKAAPSIRSAGIGVFFDEARQVLTPSDKGSILLPAGLVYELAKYRPVSPGSSYHELRLRPEIGNLNNAMDIARAYFSSMTRGTQRALTELVEALTNSRYAVYSYFPKQLREDLDTLSRGVWSDSSTADVSAEWKTRLHKYSTFKLLLPRRIFASYRSVVIASAWLEHSQLFHMLKRQKDVELVDITHKLHDKRDPVTGKRRIDLIRRRLSKVTIVPLLNDDAPVSKSQLSLILCSPAARKELAAFPDSVIRRDSALIQRYLSATGLTAKLIRRQNDSIDSFDGAVSPKSSPVVHKIHELYKRGELFPDPLLYLATRALRLFAHQHPGLRDVVGRPIEERPLFIANERGPKDEMLSKNSPLPGKRGQATFAELVDSQRLAFISSYSHGLNTYQGCDKIAFLSAINPTPHVIRLLPKLLGPDYDHRKDFLISTCGQSVARTSMRDVRSTAPVTVVVPTAYLAHALCAHFHNLPHVLREGDMTGRHRISNLTFTDLDTLLYGNERQRERLSRVVSKTAAERSADSTKKLRSAVGAELVKQRGALRVKLSRARAALAQSPDDATLQQRVASIQAEQRTVARKIEQARLRATAQPTQL